MEPVDRLGHPPDHKEAHDGDQQGGDGGNFVGADLESLLEKKYKNDDKQICKRRRKSPDDGVAEKFSTDPVPASDLVLSPRCRPHRGLLKLPATDSLLMQCRLNPSEFSQQTEYPVPR